MGLCPVDLVICERTGCRRDGCELADTSPQLLICWECGSLESGAVAAGVCVACLRVYVPDPATEVI